MLRDDRDYKVELSSAGASASSGDGTADTGRPYLSVLFDCCRIYLRIYRSADGQSYAGRCPRCGKPVRFAVGNNGTAARSFIVR